MLKNNKKSSAPKEEIIANYVKNTSDDGRFGRSFEVDFREILTGVSHRMHPLGIADITVKRGVTVECKSGCGWLVSPEFDSAEEAMEYFVNSYKPMLKASHVAYLPKWTGDNTRDAIVLTQRKFLEILSRHNLIRTKGKKGSYGVAIQSYIPTPTFRASQKRYDAFLEDLADNGEIVEEFAERIYK